MRHSTMKAMKYHKTAALYRTNALALGHQSFSSDGLQGIERREFLSGLYKDALIQQAVNVPIQDSLADWRTISDAVLKRLDAAYAIKRLILNAAIDARIYSKSLIIPVLQDANQYNIPLTTSLDKTNGASLVRFVIANDFDVGSNETSIKSKNYGNPAYYLVGGVKVHSSRAFMIQANRAGISLIELVYSYLCSFNTRNSETTKAVEEANWLALATDLKMLSDIAQAKIEASGSSANAELIATELIRNRLMELRHNANNNGAWGYDKDTEKVEQVSKTNIKDMVEATEQAAKFLAGAVDIPMWRFLGYRVGGLGGGNNENAGYAQSLKGLRTFLIEPALAWIDALLVQFNPDVKSIDYQWNPITILGESLG